jgi:phage terminase large subunit-like protein
VGRYRTPLVDDYVSKADWYLKAVLSGKVPACKWVRLACERQQHDLSRQRARKFPYYFDRTAGNDICQAMERFPHIKGPLAKKLGVDDNGKDVWNTITLEPWQCFIQSTAFAWKRTKDDMRRFRIALVLVPRKNSKSTMAATTGLYLLGPDGESGAEVFSAATRREQAKIIWDTAREMARRTPYFCDHFGVAIGAQSIIVRDTASKFEALSADAHSLDGLNVHGALIDELHAHRTRHVWDVIETATGARSQPILYVVSTAGVDTAGICYELLTYLHKILDGIIQDETFFGLNYTIDEGDDWRLEATHRKANPNFGVSVHADDLARKVKKAEHSPAATNNFLTKHLDVWVKAETTWLPAAEWRGCMVKGLSIEQCIGHPCWVIVDMAEVRDIAAKMALFQLPEGRFATFGQYYLPKKTVDTSPNALYSGWVHQGHLIATDGDVADYQRIEDDIVADVGRFLPREVVFDRALASRMMQNVQKRLGEDTPVVVVPQNIQTIDPAMSQVEELVFGRKLQHDGDEILAWMVSNVVVVRNHKGEIFPRKAGGKDSHNKIDGVFTLLMGLSRAMAPPDDDDGPSIYESRTMVSV